MHRSRSRPLAQAIAAECRNESAGSVELLDAGVLSIDDVDIAIGIDGNPGRKIKLTVSRALRPPLSQVLPVEIEDLHSMIATVRHVGYFR